MKIHEVKAYIKEYQQGELYAILGSYEPRVDKFRDQLSNISNEIIDSGDSNKVLKYMEDHCEELTDYECMFLIKKYVCLDAFNKLEEKNADKKYTPEEMMKWPEVGEVIMGVLNEDIQHTTNGCWSCAYTSLLKSRKIDINQTIIRAYRGNETKEENKLEFASANSNSPLNPIDKADILMKLVPNTAMREISFKISANQLVEKRVKVNRGRNTIVANVLKDDVKKDLAELIVNNARNSIYHDKSPVALLVGGHFVTIVGFAPNGNPLVYDSNLHCSEKPVPMEVNMEKYLDIQYNNNNGNISMVSLVDINVNKQNPTGTLLPPDFKHFKVKNDNGEIETVKSKEDDTVFDDITGSKAYFSADNETLPKTGLQYTKTIYMPKQLNTNVIELERPVEQENEQLAENQEKQKTKVEQLYEKDMQLDKAFRENARKVADNLTDAHNGLLKLNISSAEDKKFNEIQTLIYGDWDRTYNQPHIEKLCFDYITDNVNMVNNPDKRARFDAVLATLGTVNFKLAERLEHEINNFDSIKKARAAYNHKHTKHPLEPVSTIKALEKYGRPEVVGGNKNTIETKASEDPRIANIQKIYNKLTEKYVGSVFHINSYEYEKMLKSMKHCLVYATMIKGGDANREVLNEMLKEVAECATDYVLNNARPSSELGKARQELALAALYTASKDKVLAEDIIGGIAAVRKTTNDSKGIFSKMFGSVNPKEMEASKYLSVSKIVEDTNINIEIGHEEKLDYLYNRLKNSFSVFPRDQEGLEKIHADYVITRSMYEKLSKMTPDQSKDINVSFAELMDARDKLRNSPEFIKAFNDLTISYEERHADMTYIKPEEVFHKYNEECAKEEPKPEQKSEPKPEKKVEAQDISTSSKSLS